MSDGPKLIPLTIMQDQINNPREVPLYDPEQQTLLLDTAIGQLKASWERCHSLLRSSADPPSVVNVVKCLGIPYGKIPYRWAAPRKETFPWRGVKNCTKFGPQCPQADEILFDVEGLPVFGSLDKNSFAVQGDSQDEFACLNLNIFGPLDIVREGEVSLRKLPVLVWVHGGAYWTGSAGVDLYGR